MRILNFKQYFLCIFFFVTPGLFAQSLLSETIEDISTTDFYLHSKLEKIAELLQDRVDLKEQDDLANQKLILLLDAATKLLAKSKTQEALALLRSFSTTPIQKNDIFESYLFLTSYLSFILNQYQENYIFSKKYLENFGDYTESYTILYFHLYSSLKTDQDFVFESVLRNKDFISQVPVIFNQPIRRLIIEYAQISRKYDLGIQYILKEEQEALLLAIIAKTYDFRLLTKYNKVFTSPKIKNEIFFRQTELLYFNKDLAQVTQNLLEVSQNQGRYQAKLLKKFSDLKKKIQTKKNPAKIGVLMPFSIFNPTVKKIVLQIQTSINIFFQEHQEDYEFLFVDTALNPETTKEGYKKLVDAGVMAIIGPISRLNSEAILASSTLNQIPVFSLTTNENIGKNYPYFYRYQRNKLKENRLLANYVVDYLQNTNIIAFYDSKKTLANVLSFQDELKKRGVNLITIEKVEFDNLNIQNSFRKVTGIYRYLNRYEEKIYKVLEEQNTTPLRIDAIYLPFSADKINLISSFLASYNLQDVNLLTNAVVNTPDIYNYSFRNLYFADNFYFQQKGELLEKYTRYHWLTDASAQPLIYGTIVYELLKMLDEIFYRFEIKRADDLKYRLDQINFFSFLETPLNIDKIGEFSKEYNIYRFSRNKIFPVF